MFSSVTSDCQPVEVLNRMKAWMAKKGKHNALLTFPLNLPLNKLVKYHKPAPQSRKKTDKTKCFTEKKINKKIQESTLVAALFPSSQPSIPHAYSVKPRTQPHVSALSRHVKCSRFSIEAWGLLRG